MKQLTIAFLRKNGRNHQGKITSFHRGGGFRRRYRCVDFGHMLKGLVGYVVREEYDPFRTAPLFLVYYENGYFSYHLSVFGVCPGMFLWSGRSILPWLGSSQPLSLFSTGTFLFNINGKYGRTAGSKGQLLKQYGGWSLVKLPSGEEKFFPSDCWATWGRVSGWTHRFEKKRKAGDSRHQGRRPIVRGVAMNPVDHPHGGGEGKTSGGRPSVSPWGKLTKGKKTRRR